MNRSHWPLLVLCSASTALAYPNGISGRAESGCSQCHINSDLGNRPTVTLTGPSAINAGATQTFTLTVQGGPGVLAGFDISVDGGTVATKSANEVLKDGEVTHAYPATMDGGLFSWAFSVTAGTGGAVTVYGSGLSSNGQGVIEDGGDRDNQAIFTVPISGGHAPPTVAQAAAPGSSPVTTSSVAMSVLGADATQSASTLVYTWAATSSGSGTATFSPNGAAGAENTTATFTAAGTYSVTVTISNSVNETVTSTVSVDVVQTATGLEMTPTSPTVAEGSTVTFSMMAMDQFGMPMTPTGSTTWSANGDGTITSAGVFTAGAQAGTATVVATMGSVASSTTVTINATGGTGTTGPGPMASFTAPAMGATLSGMVTLQVSVVDATALKWVTFGVDGMSISVSTGPTYSAMYDTKLLPNGPHTFTAMAIDKAGGMGSATTEVMFNNPNSPTMNSPMAGCGAAAGLAPWIAAGVLAALRRRRRS